VLHKISRWPAICEFLNGWLARQHTQRNIPGFAVHIMHRHETVFSCAFGLADIDDGVRLTTDHRFNIGSQSKFVTALVVMQLVADGRIELEAAASVYVKWLGDHYDERMQRLTVRDLLSHRGGLSRDLQDADFWQGERAFPESSELQADVMSSAPVVNRGEWKYSNVGYALLGQVIEAVTAQDFATYSSSFLNRVIARTSDGHGAKAKSYGLNERRFSAPQSFGAYGAVTGHSLSAPEMAKLLSKCAFDENSVANRYWLAIRSATQDTGNGTLSYGLGVEVFHFHGRTVAGHSGGCLGYRSSTFVDEERSVVVSIAGNSIDTPILEMSRGVFGVIDHFWSGAVDSPFVGKFENAWETVQIVATPGRLVSIDPTSWTPFRWINDEFTVVDSNTLRITNSRQSHFQGELVHYAKSLDGVTRSIRLGGVTAVRQPDVDAIAPHGLLTSET
jgi:D-alanyl-D-alanine carboxypeptidase